MSVDGFVLFSRLQGGGWPDTNAITEWALRVSTKLSDMESGNSNSNKDDLLNKTIQIEKSRTREPYAQGGPLPP